MNTHMYSKIISDSFQYLSMFVLCLGLLMTKVVIQFQAVFCKISGLSSSARADKLNLPRWIS